MNGKQCQYCGEDIFPQRHQCLSDDALRARLLALLDEPASTPTIFEDHLKVTFTFADDAYHLGFVPLLEQGYLKLFHCRATESIPYEIP